MVFIFSGHYAAVIKRLMEYFMKNVKVPNKILTYFEKKLEYSSYSPKKIVKDINKEKKIFRRRN